MRTIYVYIFLKPLNEMLILLNISKNLTDAKKHIPTVIFDLQCRSNTRVGICTGNIQFF